MTNPTNNTEPLKIGDIVTLKSHPLAFPNSNGLIDGYVNQIPPFMCIKEIHYEKKKKKYSAEAKNTQIADNTKYLCVYFNQHRMVFEEKMIYNSMLTGLDDNIIFHREDYKNTDNHKKTLIDETLEYKELSEEDYEYGKLVFFKTYKLERRKKFVIKSIDENNKRKSAIVHTSPAFILNGHKRNDTKSIFDEKKGHCIKETSEVLYKVLWYNAYQEKMSEDYMPKELFTDDHLIYTDTSSTP